MTRAVAVLRSSILLLLTVGVLLMHTDGAGAASLSRGSVGETAVAMAGMPAMDPGAVVRMAVGGQRHATAAHLSGPSSPTPGDIPSACGGGPVCRAVLADPHELVVPAGLSSVPPVHGVAVPRLVTARNVTSACPPLPPPSRELLQVWRC